MAKRILFVDDDQSLLVLYRRFFTRAGYEVQVASSAEQALQVFRNDTPDAVVVDVRLAEDREGLDLLGKILILRRIPAVINTAYASFRESFLSWMADAYVIKSSDLTELAETLDRVLSAPGVCASAVSASPTLPARSPACSPALPARSGVPLLAAPAAC